MMCDIDASVADAKGDTLAMALGLQLDWLCVCSIRGQLTLLDSVVDNDADRTVPDGEWVVGFMSTLARAGLQDSDGRSRD